MEHTEISSVRSSVGELNKGECVCRGARKAAMHRNTHQYDTPVPAVSPSPGEKKLPILWTLHEGTAKHWPEERQLC